MKKNAVGAIAVLGMVVGVGLVVAVARPDLLPAWIRPAAKEQAADSGLFCDEHGVPEKFCTLCHPELKDKLLLCAEHGDIPEDICTLCHPEVEKQHKLRMCPKGHGLPEHFCTQCQGANGDGQASSNLINDGWCAEFGEAGADGTKRCRLLPMVRLASSELAVGIGLKTATLVEEEHVHELVANAETDYDANRYAEIHPRVAGFLREAALDLGQRAAAGQVVAVVDSSEVSTAKAQYINAHAAFDLARDTHDRVTSLRASNAVAAKEEIGSRAAVNQAQAALLDAEQRLRNLRFGDDDLARILAENDTLPLLSVTTPLAGTVVFRHAVLGESVEPTTRLFAVADTARMWLWVDVFERDVAKVEAGQEVAFTVMGGGAEGTALSFVGRVTWVGTEVDRTTRTTRVRAELSNPDGKLRAHQFGKARIELGTPHRAITVPKSAVQRYEGVELVFLAESPGVYRPQRIKTRPLGEGDVHEVTWGLKADQRVVTDGSFLLKTEIMKGSIGAGCCD